jgi:hypothetical protein
MNDVRINQTRESEPESDTTLEYREVISRESLTVKNAKI